ncbi:MAG TPA: DMT family transporter, partial [Polyangia bacterium]
MGFGIVMGLLASASWAAANVFIQRAGRAVGPFRALVWAQVTGGLLLLPIALLLDHRSGVTPGAEFLTWTIVAALSAVVAYTSMFYAFERGRLSVVVPVMSSWSVIAAAVSIAILHQRIRHAQLAGASSVVLGVLIVSRYAQADPHAGVGTSGRARGALGASIAAALGFGVLIPAIDRL